MLNLEMTSFWVGWYRYDSKFALPVYDDKGELERYNIFHASMLVRHSNDGKLYLYDVIDMSYVFLSACDSRRLINERDYIEVYFVE